MSTEKEPTETQVRLGYHFTIVPDAVLDDENLETIPKLVFCIISRHANRDGTAFPSLTRIAKKAGCSRSSVQEAIKALSTAGYLVKESRRKPGGKEFYSNTYTLQAPIVSHDREAPEGVPPDDPGGVPPHGIGVPPGGKEVDVLEVDSTYVQYSTDFTSAEDVPCNSRNAEDVLARVNKLTGLGINLHGFTTKYLALEAKNTLLTDAEYFRHVWQEMNREKKPLTAGMFLNCIMDEPRQRRYVDEIKARENATQSRKEREILMDRYMPSETDDPNDTVTSLTYLVTHTDVETLTESQKLGHGLIASIFGAA